MKGPGLGGLSCLLRFESWVSCGHLLPAGMGLESSGRSLGAPGLIDPKKSPCWKEGLAWCWELAACHDLADARHSVRIAGGGTPPLGPLPP